MHRSLRLAALLLMSCPPLVSASSYSVNPIRVSIRSDVTTTALEIGNDSDEVLFLQLSVLEWSQDQTGADQLKPSGDLVVFPKILNIAKGEAQTVRIGYRGQGPRLRERTYRVLVQELNRPDVTHAGTAVHFLMNILIPVFVVPEKTDLKASFEQPEISEGNLLVRVRNDGTAHDQFHQIRVTGLGSLDQQAFSKAIPGWYVLPGVSKTFTTPISLQECLDVHGIELSGERQDGTEIRERFELDPERCHEKFNLPQLSMVPAGSTAAVRP